MQIMTEPNYEYIKGQGWVPSNVPTAVFEAKGYRVTVEVRLPKKGELYFYEPTTSTLDVSVSNLINKERHVFPCGRLATYDHSHNDYGPVQHYRVCTFEKLDNQP